MSVLSTAVSHYRSTFCILFLVVAIGIFSRGSMTIESNPNVEVPLVTVSVYLDGVSPEDGARLLVRPMEKELRTIEGVKEINATARESMAYVLVEFEAEAKLSEALSDVREAIDRAKAELPRDAEEPVVKEVSAVDMPTVVIALSGSDVPERVLFQSAQFLKRKLEEIPDVLSADMNGYREEVVEAVIDPARLEHYNITSDELINAVLANNLLVPAGTLDDGTGKFAVKVPGLIESAKDVYGLPLKTSDGGLVTLGDVAQVHRTFKDSSTHTSIRGKRAITVEVKKRTGSNLIEVAETARRVVEEHRHELPKGVEISFLLDQSPYTKDMVSEMEGNIVTAMSLVMVIVVAALGFRSGLLVGLGIPFSLLFALIITYQMGFSFNFMVMFGMLLALGMLIDGAIVITEFADRKMAEGLSSKAAYQISVKRMFWPVVASTATTLAAFLPLMFWPGVAGQFMSYLPVTVFAVLTGSLLYALFFAPVMGSLLGRTRMEKEVQQYLKHLETKAPETLSGLTGRYARLLASLLRHPVLVFVSVMVILVIIFKLYGAYNAGGEFFTESEDPYGTITVRAQGNFSAAETEDIVREVEARILKFPEVYSTYTTSGGSNNVMSMGGGGSSAKDTIGSIFFELYAPQTFERKVREVIAEMNVATDDMPGIYVNAKALENGPPVGKPIQVQLESNNLEKLLATTRMIQAHLFDNVEGLRDVTDSSPLPGIEWQMIVDRGLAAQMGANVVEVGRAVQLVTNGVKVGEYRPDDADDEVDIRVRFPEYARGISELDRLRINTINGPVPISRFVTRKARPKVDKVQRMNGIQVMTVSADVELGVLADNKVKEVQAWLAETTIDPQVKVIFRGANEEQEKSQAFLSVAFSLALFLMFVLLVTQFNSFYQGFLILSAVVMSTAGVLLGLLITQDTFSTILTGVGIVALAGIVVNNNIVLIDTYNYVRLHDKDLSPAEAAVKASAQRLRPVFLTTLTTILGLLPIAMNLSVDLIGRNIVEGGSIASNWKPLASAIVHGLAFSTILTLVVTPVMLILPGELKKFFASAYQSVKQNIPNTLNR
jgi:multidrug efflux pump